MQPFVPMPVHVVDMDGIHTHIGSKRTIGHDEGFLNCEEDSPTPTENHGSINNITDVMNGYWSLYKKFVP